MRKIFTQTHMRLAAIGAAIVMSMAVASAQQAWDGTAAQWTQGEGTSTAPYLIETPAQLAWLSQQVAAGESYEGKYFQLAADLDMGADQGQKFTMIGTFDDKTEDASGSHYFKGTFNGDYHTIDNLQISCTSSETSCAGLFASIVEGTVIRNLRLGARSSITGPMAVGGFVGYMNEGGQVENCENAAAVTATDDIMCGGIAGLMEGTSSVIGCVNTGSVTGTTDVGGIVGQGANSATVAYCYSTGPVKAVGYGGGGIAGALYNTFALKNCYSISPVTGNSNVYMGVPHAIVSDAGTATVSDCYYVQALSGQGDTKATAKTEAEMKSAATIAALNGDAIPTMFVADENTINGGFPVLYWQAQRPTSIQGIAQGGEAPFIKVSDRTLRSNVPMRIYSITGACVGTGLVRSVTKGAYIVKAGGTTLKIVVK